MAEVNELLQQLQPKNPTLRKIARLLAYTSLKDFGDSLQADIPERTGTLKNSVTISEIKRKKAKRGYTVAYYAGYSRYKMHDGRRAYHARLFEHGTHQRRTYGRGKVTPYRNAKRGRAPGAGLVVRHLGLVSATALYRNTDTELQRFMRLQAQRLARKQRKA